MRLINHPVALTRTLALRLFYNLPRIPKALPLSTLPPIPLGQRWGRAPSAPLSLWPRVHYRYITYRDAPSDLRTVWEPSRFRWARPEDFPDGFESWRKANPVGIGPNWRSSLEVAVRAINWVFLLEGANKLLSPEAKRLALRWLVAHGRHLLANSEPHPLNHALGRALGLFVIGGYMRALPEAESWFRQGSREFSSLFPMAFLPDGSYAEAAPGYGAFALEMGLIYIALAREWGAKDELLNIAVQRGLSFMADLAWPDGSFPIIGDFDNGGVLRPPDTEYTAYLKELAEIAGLDFPEPGLNRHYPKGGFLFMRNQSVQLVARVGDDPDLPGGHTHSDIGSFALWMREPVVVDPGVYLYTGPGSLREELRSETAHNLVWLEGKPMHIRDPLRPFTLEGRKSPLFSGWEGESFVLRHDLFGPVAERRFSLSENGVAIEDSVSLPGPWRVGFTLCPDIVPEPSGRGFTLRGKAGVYSISLEKGSGTWSAERAVFCPRYGEKSETVRLVLRPEGMAWRVRFGLI